MSNDMGAVIRAFEQGLSRHIECNGIRIAARIENGAIGILTPSEACRTVRNQVRAVWAAYPYATHMTFF